jgi:hypothetical protein
MRINVERYRHQNMKLIKVPVFAIAIISRSSILSHKRETHVGNWPALAEKCSMRGNAGSESA